MRATTLVLSLTLAWASFGSVADAADRWGLKVGRPELKSAAVLAAGPDGILFVGDSKAATVFAIATGDTEGKAADASYTVEGINAKVAQTLKSKSARINDLAVNPETGTVFLAVTKGEGEAASPALVKLSSNGDLSEISLKNVAYSKVTFTNAPEDKVVRRGRRSMNRRDDSITDLAWIDGKVIASGLSNASSGSTVRELVFPFVESDAGATVEIYHGAHGRSESYAAIRTFVPFNINGKPNLLAGYVCTPLVKFPLDDLKSGQKTTGTTIAELGNRNRPLDMIVYQKDGKDFLLLTNSARGVMKISTEDIARSEGITERVGGGGTAGQKYETIKSLTSVVQLDKLNDTHAVIIAESNGSLNLKSVELP